MYPIQLFNHTPRWGDLEKEREATKENVARECHERRGKQRGTYERKPLYKELCCVVVYFGVVI